MNTSCLKSLLLCVLCMCFVLASSGSPPVFSQQFYAGGHLTEQDSRQLIEWQQYHLADFYHNGNRRITIEVDPSLEFDNDRLRDAFIALQTWKRAIFSDPFNITGNWVGPDVCNYKGVFCEEALDDPCIDTVAGIDLNHAD
eukprot:c11324_g1_i1 orf=920-1342(+)